MSMQSFLAKAGLRTAVLGTASSLAMAFPIADGDMSVTAHTAASRIGFYCDRTAAAEKVGVVVMGVEVLSTGAAGTTIAGNVALGGASLQTSTALRLPAATAPRTSLRIPHGVAPTLPVDGDIWTTTAGLFYRANGVTYNPTVGGSAVSGRVAFGDVSGNTLTNSASLTFNYNTLTVLSSADVSALSVQAPSITGSLAINIQNVPLSTDVNTGKAFGITPIGDGFARVLFYTDGKYGVGPGNATRDTILSRSAVATWRMTGDGATSACNLEIFGALSIGGALSTSTALLTPAGTTAVSSLRLPHGVAPSAPVNGDVWTTSSSFNVQINGSLQSMVYSGGGAGNNRVAFFNGTAYGLSGTGSFLFAPTTTGLTYTQAVVTSGSPSVCYFTGGAHTTLAAGAEASDIFIGLARTVQFATGAIATQRAVKITAPTYGFVGASTITTAVTVDIAGAPAAGTNATLTNAYALRVLTGYDAAVGVAVRANSGTQSGDLQQWQDSTGVRLSAVKATGAFILITGVWHQSSDLTDRFNFTSGGNTTFRVPATAKFRILDGLYNPVFALDGDTGKLTVGFGVANDTTFLGTVSVGATTAATKALVVRAAAAQSATLQEWQDSSGNIYGAVDSAGYFGIGTGVPTARLNVVSATNDSGLQSRFENHFNANTPCGFVMVKSRGTKASPTSVLDQDLVAAFYFTACDSVNILRNSGYFGTRVNGTVANNSVPQEMFFGVTPGYNSSAPFADSCVQLLISPDTTIAINSVTKGTAQFNIFNGLAARVAMIVKGIAAQSGDLTQWQNSAGSQLVSIAAAGDLRVGATSGGTQNGNAICIVSDTYPGWTFRSATAVKSQILAEMASGNLLVDVTPGASAIIRDGINGANGPIVTLKLTGSTFVSPVITPAATTSATSIRIPHGVAPSAPTNGDIWTTTAGVFARINGATQTLVSGTGAAGQISYWSGTGTQSGNGGFTLTTSGSAGQALYFNGNTNDITTGAATASFNATYSATPVSGSYIGVESRMTMTGSTVNISDALAIFGYMQASVPSASMGACVFAGVVGQCTTSGGTTNFYSSATSVGFKTNAGHSGAATSGTTLGNLIGLQSNFNATFSNASGSQTITNVYGAQINPNNFATTTGGAAVVTNFYAFFAASVNATGGGTLTVTNLYGLYLSTAVSGVASATNKWGVYQADSAAGNFFNGFVRVGALQARVTSIATSQAIPATSGTYIRFTGAAGQTLTLPAANAATAGYCPMIFIRNVSANSVTIARAGADTIDGLTSISLPSGAGVMVASDGVSAWESN